MDSSKRGSPKSVSKRSNHSRLLDNMCHNHTEGKVNKYSHRQDCQYIQDFRIDQPSNLMRANLLKFLTSQSLEINSLFC